MTTAQQLIHHDIEQSNRIMQRYYKSSSLPFTEKRKHKPEVCKYRRDRVLHAIMNREMERVLRIIGSGQPARGGGYSDSLSRRADNT